jgi:hypothetical protein
MEMPPDNQNNNSSLPSEHLEQLNDNLNASKSPKAKIKKTSNNPDKSQDKGTQENRIVKLLEKNPLGMTLPEMAGGNRQLKKIKALRPQLSEAIKSGLVMPVSQRAGNTVYRLVKYLSSR